MNNPVNTIEEYLAQFTEEEVSVINQLRDRIKELLPKGYVEEMHYNMITYVVPLSYYPKGYHVTKGMPLPYFAIAKQKHFYALYHMGYYAKPEMFSEFVSQYNALYGKLDMGKSCMRFKKVEKIPFDLLELILSKISVDEYISFYEDNTTNLNAKGSK
jgi:hypothetical protein